jgi:hypothetical protein
MQIMKIDYSLDKADFLEYQLYTASKSDTVRNTIRKSRFSVPIVYAILGLLLLTFKMIVLGLIFFGLALGWYYLFPLYNRGRYVRYLNKYLDEYNKNKFDKPVTLTFSDDYIESSDFMSVSKFKVKEIAEVNEIEDYIFIKLTTSESFIIPKNKISNLDNLNERLMKIVSDLGINHNIDLNWKWR